MAPEIIFENKDFLVLNKPAGFVVHPKTDYSDSKEQTLVSWLIKNYPQIKNVGDNPEIRPGIVHRLDKETSGVMVITKNQNSFETFKNIFKQRSIEKIYLALVIGKMNNKEGKINLAITRSISIKRTTKIREGQKALKAETLWEVLKTYQDNNQILSYLKLIPKTGRTHQLRVHLAAIGHPVVGDYLYGGKTTLKYREKLNRIFLHAYSLRFKYDNTNYLFEAELPIELKNFLKELKILKEN
jgi:23S rRNA pseudouridine1911/1915/1917 synthase